MKNKPFVIVGMSGGVDSSVAAYLLTQQHYQVEAVFMKNWEETRPQGECPATIDLQHAQSVCDRLNIRLHQVNFAQAYWDKVFAYFLEEYQQGRTPNPDILCNKEIKFKAFLDYAIDLGADYIATGHYAQCQKTPTHQYHLLKGKDANKDQSYFLYALNQHQLAHSLFPIGNLKKPAVRALAKQLGFDNHNKKDSTGICFIGERRFNDFLKQFLPAQPGKILTDSGEVIGQHQGLMFYTIGQRKGLGIGGLHNFAEFPWYVIDKRLASNELIVAQGDDHPGLYHWALLAKQLHWIDQPPQDNTMLSAKTRYRQTDQTCKIQAQSADSALITFEKPQRAITPGQSVVFYQENTCLGGGIIVGSAPDDEKT